MPATLTHLIPASELAQGQAGAIRNQVIEKMVAMASKEGNLAIDKLIVRDIRPAGDLDYGTEDWFENTGATTGTYETMTTGTSADGRWIGIYGIKDDSDTAGSCSMIKFNIGGADRVIWSLQSLNEDDGFVGISPAGVVIPQRTPYTISRYVIRASRAAHLVLKGVVVEARGLVVSP